MSIDLSVKDQQDLNMLYDEDIPCYWDDCQNPIAWRMIMHCCGKDYKFCKEHGDKHREEMVAWHETFRVKRCAACQYGPLDLMRIRWIPV